MKYYILMADIIESSRKTSAALMQDFSEICNHMNKNFRNYFHSPITITLGDEFQSIVKSIKEGVNIIVEFEETIIHTKKGFKLRYVLNYGDINTPINRKRAHGMLGSGLTETRDMLSGKKQERGRFLIKDRDPVLSEKINQAFFIYQSFIDGWKLKDYGIVSAFLKYRDYKRVADVLIKNRSLMWKREKSLKINEYLAVKKLINLILE
ncbi:MAG: hypothetical protein JXB26_09920 [Candidatus Aminicenantes bacterium]|nr:hypothetical protein [Candidatus Aminicenantes bacterium]